MLEVFVDGVRSIGIANGVVRIEFAQLRRTGEGEAKMTPEPVATLMIPSDSMKGLLAQLSTTMKQIQDQAKAKKG